MRQVVIVFKNELLNYLIYINIIIEYNNDYTIYNNII